MNRLLSGVRVLDLTRMLAGPYGTMLMGDLGAEVIKIEDETGDFTRGFADSSKSRTEVASYFMSVNRNKKSIVLDFKDPRGKEIFYRLVAISDVVIDNMRPQALKRLGFDYEDLKKHNPKIISCSISGYGHDGPYRDRPAFDLSIQALSGAMGLTGEKGGKPTRLGLPVGDLAGGMFATIGILAALHRREQTGHGEKLDISLLDGLISMSSYLAASCFFNQRDPGPQGSRHESIVPYQSFLCKDKWLVVACVTPKFWEGLCRVLGLERLITDERFDGKKKRLENYEELIPILQEAFLKKNADEWLEDLNREGVPSAPVNTLEEALNDPQVAHRKMVIGVQHPRAGEVKVVGNVVKTKGIEDSFTCPPDLGSDTRSILTQLLGYTAEQVQKLESDKVVIGWPQAG